MNKREHKEEENSSKGKKDEMAYMMILVRSKILSSKQ